MSRALDGGRPCDGRRGGSGGLGISLLSLLSAAGEESAPTNAGGAPSVGGGFGGMISSTGGFDGMISKLAPPMLVLRDMAMGLRKVGPLALVASISAGVADVGAVAGDTEPGSLVACVLCTSSADGGCALRTSGGSSWVDVSCESVSCEDTYTPAGDAPAASCLARLRTNITMASTFGVARHRWFLVGSCLSCHRT